VNSSGLIYAVIVGAWAAYLVPMWLRRQDELNESRPTERFSTAIRLLSGKAAMERRYAKGTERRDEEVPAEHGELAGPVGGPEPERDGAHEDVPDETVDDAVDVRAYADPKTMVGDGSTAVPTEILARSADQHVSDEAKQSAAERNKARQSNKRAKVLARRRRTTMLLFLAFTAGTVVAAVGGLAFLWAPGAPGLLLSTYIVHLRVQERRRFAVTMDKRQAEVAAQRLRERQPGRPVATDRETEAVAGIAESDDAPEPAAAKPVEQPGAADRRALVEQTDHAEWVDQQRHGDREAAEGWDPVPVPLPTYVSAPVAPRTTRGVDLEAPDTWSSARSSTASGEPAVQEGQDDQSAPGRRRGRGHGRTPLFDQYENEDRPRAANE